MSKRNITIIIAIILIVFAGLIFMRFMNPKNPKPIEVNKTNLTEGLKVEWSRVKKSDIEDRISFAGIIFPKQQAVILSKVSGKLHRYLVQEGDKVNTGDIIAEIDRDDPGVQFVLAPVRATMAGIIAKRYIDEGTSVSPASQSVTMATPIILIVNIDIIKVEFSVIESEIAKVKLGQKVEITTSAYPDKKFYGGISKINTIADSVNHMTKVEVEINNSDNVLKSGMSADINLIVNRHTGVSVIPVGSIVKIMGEDYVYVVDNSVVKKKKVVLGYTDGNYFEVISGVYSGEILIVSDLNMIQDGIKVQLK
ncbi:MAG: efflux RND transporter periplasmic adaptor subunit [Candidatus Firestonebacteria bacterium]